MSNLEQMREIKFRVWDKVDKQMKIPVLIDFEMESVRVLCGSGYAVRKFDEIEFLQYTGLKDKNGKEIYYGDIVRRESLFSEDNLYEIYKIVVWNYGFYAIRRKDGSMLTMSDLFWVSDIEVIGNIYENPELLEENNV